MGLDICMGKVKTFHPTAHASAVRRCVRAAAVTDREATPEDLIQM